MAADILMTDAGQSALRHQQCEASDQRSPDLLVLSSSQTLHTSQQSPTRLFEFSTSPFDKQSNGPSDNISPLASLVPSSSENLLWQQGRARSSPLSQDNGTEQHEQKTSIVTQQQPPIIGGSRVLPQIVATVRRSRRAGDDKPALEFSDKTDVIASTVTTTRLKSLHPISNSAAIASSLSSSPAINATLSTAEARRLGLPLPRRTSSGFSLILSNRKSLTFSPAPSPLSSQTDLASLSLPSNAVKITPRNSLTSPSFPRHSGGLVALAARKVERQLQERALAAFPNDDRFREPVYHYMDQNETPGASTMASSAGSAFSSVHELEIQSWHSENWELKELRAHHEKLHAEREQQRLKREARRRLHKHLNDNPWAIPVAIPEEHCTTKSIDDLIRQDRPRVRPPMLGSDIEFPRSVSPAPARFDVTQGPESLRKAMCYLSEQSEMHSSSEGSGGLWIPRKEPSTTTSCAWSRPASRNPSTAGLWGGSCIDNDSPPRGPTGLMTPTLDEGSPPILKDNISLFKQQLPPSPPISNSGVAVLEEREVKFDIEAEFDDGFITQVFNYMSLGYPAIARDFDEELSKVTSTPLDQLRKDDDLPSACGYIRLGEETAAMSGVTEQSCARWKALKSYVHEWARQHPKMAQLKPVETGWTAARKGSWAW